MPPERRSSVWSWWAVWSSSVVWSWWAVSSWGWCGRGRRVVVVGGGRWPEPWSSDRSWSGRWSRGRWSCSRRVRFVGAFEIVGTVVAVVVVAAGSEATEAAEVVATTAGATSATSASSSEPGRTTPRSRRSRRRRRASPTTTPGCPQCVATTERWSSSPSGDAGGWEPPPPEPPPGRHRSPHLRRHRRQPLRDQHCGGNGVGIRRSAAGTSSRSGRSTADSSVGPGGSSPEPGMSSQMAHTWECTGVVRP